MHDMRVGSVLPLMTLLVGCAGGGRAPSSPHPAPAELHVYEVAPEQGRRMEAHATEVPPEPGYLEVSGSASVALEPTAVAVTFAVETRADDAAAASAANAALMERVIAAVRDAVTGVRVETFGYDLRPEYGIREEPVRTRFVQGYVATNRIRTQATDVDAAGALIDAGVGAGANRVANLEFLAEGEREARREALAAAVARARQEGEVMAQALGYELGPPLEVRGGSAAPPPQLASARLRAEVGATPIEAPERAVTANVTVRFALGPRRERR